MQQTRFVQISAYAVAAIMLLMGMMKFIMIETTGPQFVIWGYPAWFALVVGVAEIAAAILLVVPRVRLVGAGLAAVTMLGAIFTHLRMPEVGLLPLAVPLFAISAYVLWQERGRMSAVAPA